MTLNKTLPVVTTLLVIVQSAQPALGQMQLNAPVVQTVLREGTQVRMSLNQTVSSAEAHEGDTIAFTTLDDIQVGGLTVVPKGSAALATVTQAVPKRRMGRGGKLDVNIDYVRLPSGEKLPLRGIQDVRGKGNQGKMVGAMVVTGILFWPAAPLFLLVHGKDIVIPKGHEVTVFTNTDYDLAKAKTDAPSGPAPVTPPPTGASGTPLTNADVLKLKDAGLGDQLIVDKIKASSANYRLEATNLIELKTAGLSDALISAMLEASKR